MAEFKLTRDIILRYLNNDCNPGECDKIIEMIRSTSGESELKALLQEIWNNESESPVPEQVDFNAILEKLHHSIISKQLEEPVFNKVQRNDVSSAGQRFMHYFSRVAAILILPLLAYTGYKTSQEIGSGNLAENQSVTEFTTPFGVKSKIFLPDGTEVFLNGGSSIKYPGSFKGKSREVEFEGEAFFDVTENKNKPFVISTGDIRLKVLGTSFNVENYEDQSEIITTLISGKIAVLGAQENGRRGNLLELNPSQQVSIQKSTQIFKLSSDVNTYKYTSWMDGKVVFENDPMDEVLSKLARHYNVDVSFNDTDLSVYKFTATFEYENFEQVLDLISLALPVNYELRDWEKNEDNTFSRKEYNIELRK